MRIGSQSFHTAGIAELYWINQLLVMGKTEKISGEDFNIIVELIRNAKEEDVDVELILE